MVQTWTILFFGFPCSRHHIVAALAGQFPLLSGIFKERKKVEFRTENILDSARCRELHFYNTPWVSCFIPTVIMKNILTPFEGQSITCCVFLHLHKSHSICLNYLGRLRGCKQYLWPSHSQGNYDLVLVFQILSSNTKPFSRSVSMVPYIPRLWDVISLLWPDLRIV